VTGQIIDFGGQQGSVTVNQADLDTFLTFFNFFEKYFSSELQISPKKLGKLNFQLPSFYGLS
jgi:hypothetical protein